MAEESKYANRADRLIATDRLSVAPVDIADFVAAIEVDSVVTRDPKTILQLVQEYMQEYESRIWIDF